MDEVTRNLIARWAMPPGKARRREEEIRHHFPEAWVEGFEPLIEVMTNDPGDRHVLAAAVRSNSELIVPATGAASRSARSRRMKSRYRDPPLSYVDSTASMPVCSLASRTNRRPLSRSRCRGFSTAWPGTSLGSSTTSVRSRGSTSATSHEAHHDERRRGAAPSCNSTSGCMTSSPRRIVQPPDRPPSLPLPH